MAAKIEQYSAKVPTPDLRGVSAPQATVARVPIPNRFLLSSSQGAAELDRGAEKLMAGLRFREEEEARAWSATALADARLTWTQHMVERQSKAQPNAPDFTSSLLKDYDEYAEKAIAAAPSATAQRFMQDRLADLRTHIGEQAIGFEAKARIDWRRDQFTTGADKTAQLMNTDPSQYKVALAEQLAIIDASDLPPVIKSDLRQKAMDKISTAAVWSEIQRSPSAFLNSIGFNSADPKTRKSSGDLTGQTGNIAFDALPFEKRTQMFEQAIRLKAQLDSDAEKAIAKDARIRAEGAMKDAWDMFYSGKLTLAKVQEVKPLVSDNDYKSLREALRKGMGEGGQKTDPSVFRDLIKLQVDGKWDEAVQFAFTAHRNGKLSNEHLLGEVNRARSAGRQEGPKSEYERSRTYIGQSLDPGPMVQDPLGRARQAEAIDQFDRWFLSGNGKWTDADVEKRAKEIAGQYKFINLSETVMALPMPRSGSITRNTQDMGRVKADLARAAKEAQKRFDSGQYKQAEYDEEMRILNRWRKTIGDQGSR